MLLEGRASNFLEAADDSAHSWPRTWLPYLRCVRTKWMHLSVLCAPLPPRHGLVTIYYCGQGHRVSKPCSRYPASMHGALHTSRKQIRRKFSHRVMLIVPSDPYCRHELPRACACLSLDSDWRIRVTVHRGWQQLRAACCGTESECGMHTIKIVIL